MPDEVLDKAKKTVYRLLKYRLRSEQELRDKLIQRKLPASIVAQTIGYFKDNHLVDDAEFARQWTISRLKKPFGLNRIRMELKAKGIDRVVIKNVIDEASRDYDEFDAAMNLARQRLRVYGSAGPEKTKQRIYGYLLRKGFKNSDIIRVVEQL